MQYCISHHNVTCTVLLYTVLYCITLMHIFDTFYANITTVILFTWTLPQMCIPSANNVSICTIIPIYASENTVKQSLQDNEMVEMLTKNYFRGNKEGTSSCVWDWSVLGWAEWALIGQICITVWEQCPLMAIHSDCWHWDRTYQSDGLSVTWLPYLDFLYCFLAFIINYWGSKCRCAFTCNSKLVLAKQYLQYFIAVLSSVLTRRGFFKASMKCNPFYFHNLMHFQVKHNTQLERM